jgi:UDP-N-acetyl-D-mannosaminuronate dehydrogenase
MFMTEKKKKPHENCRSRVETMYKKFVTKTWVIGPKEHARINKLMETDLGYTP